MRRTSQIPAMNPEEDVRVFIALPLCNTVVQALTGIMAAIKPYAGDSWRFVPAQNLHVTLRFLGAIPGAQLSAVYQACRRGSGDTPPLHLAISGVGVFPNWRRPSVLWAGIAGDIPALQQLAARLDTELVAAGFPPADKPFQPHITFARCKDHHLLPQAEILQAVNRVPPAEWKAEETVVYQSVLHSQGPTYTALARVKLALPDNSL